MTPGQPVRREFEYVRHGTLCWMGALDVRRGKPFGFASRARHVLARGSFTSTDDLGAKLDAYVAWYLASDRPFRWSYRPKSWD